MMARVPKLLRQVLAVTLLLPLPAAAWWLGIAPLMDDYQAKTAAIADRKSVV